MKKLKRKIIPVLAALCLLCAALAAGCNNKFDPLKEGYTATVVYYANDKADGEGVFPGANGATVRTFRYKPNTPVMKPGSSKFPEPIVSGAHVSGWHIAKVGEDGLPIKDENGNFVLEEEIFDFSAGRSGGDDSVIYLVAVWSKNYKFTVDVGEAARAAGVADIVNENYSEAGSVSKPGIDPEWHGHTFYYYKDKDGNRIYDSDWENIVLDDEHTEVTVYAEWLDGIWTIVTEKSELSAIGGASNYVLDADIDFGRYENGVLVRRGLFNGAFKFRGKFFGNGHTIKNFEYTTQNNTIDEDTGSAGAFFFKDNGCIYDVKFENCVVNAKLNLLGVQTYTVGFIAGTVSGDMSRFYGLSFKDCQLVISTQAEFVAGQNGYAGVFGKIIGDGEFSVPEADRDIRVISQ